MPAVTNAANEIAVARFLAGEIGFTDIPRIIEAAMQAHTPAAYEDVDTLVDIFVDSFGDDPFLNWIMPEPRVYPAFFRLIIEELFLPRGIVHLDSEGRGAALWLPTGMEFDVPLRPALGRATAAIPVGQLDPLRVRRQ